MGPGKRCCELIAPGASTRTEPLAAKDHTEALAALLGRLEREGVQRDDIVAVGHRVVHGGDQLTEPVVITQAVITEIGRASDLAPL